MKQILDYFKKEVQPKKTTNELIDEIHETFYTEVDRLLAEAGVTFSLVTNKQDLIDKCERLKKLGFINSKEVSEAQTEITRLRQLEKENEAKQDLIEAIKHFNFKYPEYKFITEDSVKKICEKYNLVYGEIRKYVGNVPEENLTHMEKFHIDKEDECFIEERRSSWSTDTKYINYRDYERGMKPPSSDLDYCMRAMSSSYYNYEKAPLEIAAPVKDFNMTDSEVKNFKVSKIEIPDPVVLKPVMYNRKKYYLIVTAWGKEAEDELVKK